MLARTSPAARLLALGALLLVGAGLSGCFLPTVVSVLFVLVAVPVLVGAGLLVLSAAVGRRRKMEQ